MLLGVPKVVEEAIRKSAVLIEALPYIKKFRNEIVVIKLGGSAQEDLDVTRRVFIDIDFMFAAGMRPVVVYGGGKRISAAMKETGKEAVFIHGQRVTDPETMKIVARVLIDETGAELVELMREAGGQAELLNGRDHGFLKAVKRRLPNYPDVDLGCVGEPISIVAEKAATLLDRGIVPMIAPVACGTDNPAELFNINGDSAAALIATELGAAKLVFLSDTPGIFEDIKNPASMLSSVHETEVEGMISKGVITGGMIPKVAACIDGLKGGVRKAHIVSGYQPHALLLEIFTAAGVGTEIIH